MIRSPVLFVFLGHHGCIVLEPSERQGARQFPLCLTLDMAQHFDTCKNMKINQAVKSLGALAQESRLNAYRLLVCAGEEGMAAGEISDRLKIPPATLTFHLKELVNAGLISQQRLGRSIIYSLNPESMSALIEFLMQDCCQGRPELCQPEFGSRAGRARPEESK